MQGSIEFSTHHSHYLNLSKLPVHGPSTTISISNTHVYQYITNTMHIQIFLTLLTTVLLSSAKPTPGQPEARQVVTLPDLHGVTLTLPTVAFNSIASLTALVPVATAIPVPPIASGVIASVVGGMTSLSVTLPPISSIIPVPTSLLSAITGPIATQVPSLGDLNPVRDRTICAQAINILNFIASLLEDIGTGFSIPDIPNVVFPVTNATITSLLGVVDGLITECTALNDISSVS